MEERKKAYAKRDAMLAVLKNATADAKAEKRAKVLADAAIAGKNITRMKIKKSAANKDAACDDAFAGMPSVNTSHAFCNATEAAPSGRRRGLLQVAEYDITIEVNPEEVNVTAAVTELQTVGGITDITTTTVDPLVELSSVEGVATSDLTALETEVVAAAAVQAEVVAIETEVEAFETEAASLEAEADVLGAEVQEAAAEAAYAESVAEEEDRKAKDAADAVAALPPRSDDGADVDIVYVTKPKGGAAGLAGLFTAIVAAAAAFV
jgi:hypothetical protein